MNIAIVGATGNVGRKLLEVLEKLNFKFDKLYLIASDKSTGKKINFKNKSYFFSNTFIRSNEMQLTKFKI